MKLVLALALVAVAFGTVACSSKKTTPAASTDVGMPALEVSCGDTKCIK